MFCYIIIKKSEQVFGGFVMRTSSKYRRLIRQRKLRRQRSIAVVIMMALIVMIANVAFSKSAAKDEKHSVIEVVVSNGDTVWTIAEKYLPEGGNLCEFVYDISADNGIKDGDIYAGQTLYIPV